MNLSHEKRRIEVLIGTEKVALHSLNIRWWRKQIGFVGQEPVLFNTNVRENLMCPALSTIGMALKRFLYNMI